MTAAKTPKLTTAQKNAMEQVFRDKVVYRDQGIRWDVAVKLADLDLVEFESWDEGNPSMHAREMWRIAPKSHVFGPRPKSRWQR